MEVKSAPDFTELICNEILDARMHLLFDPLNHSETLFVLAREKMVHEIGARLGLFHWKATRPGIVRGTKRQGQKPKPMSGGGKLSEPIDERAHPIGKTEPATTGGQMLSSPKRTAGHTTAELARHIGADTDARPYSVIGVAV